MSTQAEVAAFAKLDRSVFNQTIQLPALRFPKQRCQELMRLFDGHTLDRPRVKCIVNDGQRTDTKLLLLKNPRGPDGGLGAEVQALLDGAGVEVNDYPLAMTYAMFSAEHVLRALLPAGIDVPQSFETVGHIAHLNLREEQLPYKLIIGQVLVDKNVHLKTVVNKIGSIDNEFRVFAMEVIGGESRLETEVMQHGIRFKLDFSQVYWNSRLEKEHERLVEGFRFTDTVVDVMAGIGPFALPAAQKGCTVYANDLNPASVHYLTLNARNNKVLTRLSPFKMDGRRFIRMLAGDPAAAAACLAEAETSEPPVPLPPSSSSSERSQADAASSGSGSGSNWCPTLPVGYRPAPLLFQHAIMNLPASAIEFLDAYNGAFDPTVWSEETLPTVHCYTFMKSPEVEADIIAKAEHYLGGKLPTPPSIHVVRDVAPKKLMLCLSFKLPGSIAFAGRSTPATTSGDATAGVRHPGAESTEAAAKGVAVAGSLAEDVTSLNGDGVSASASKRPRLETPAAS
ncbi:MAG: hypothetical protein WDW36_008466 [Sanguina aurantia]